MDEIKGTENPQAEETPQVEATPQSAAPTPEELMKQLQAELDKERAERKRLEDGYKGLQSVVNKKDQELKSSADLKSEIAEVRDTQKMLAALIAEMGSAPAEDGEAVQPAQRKQLLAKYEELEKQQAAKRLELQRKSEQEAYIKQADTVYDRAKNVFTDDEDTLADVSYYLKTGNIEAAERKVARAEKVKAPKSTETPAGGKQETEDERIERKAREILVKQGKLNADAGGPSASTRTRTDIIRLYAEGDPRISGSDYEKAMGSP